MTTLIIPAVILLLLIVLYLFLLKGNRQNPETAYFASVRYAHRGYHRSPMLPENSLAAFREARARGYGIELDVHLMRDGKLAVIHDASLARTAGVDVQIEDLTESDLKQYTLEGTEEHIPTFQEVLAQINGTVPLLIECKAERGNAAALCRALQNELSDYAGKYCVESFDPRCLLYLKKHADNIVRGQLAENFLRDRNTKCNPFLKIILSSLVLNVLTKPDFIAYRFTDRNDLPFLLSTRLWKTAGLLWTITHEADIKTAEHAGYGVIFELLEKMP